MTNMKKQRFTLLATSLLACGSLFFASCSDASDNPIVDPQPEPGAADYTVRQVPINRGGVPGGNVSLRFYNDLPGVAYISVTDYQNLIYPGTSVSTVKTGEGTFLLTGPEGTANVNTIEETFSSTDYMGFTNLMGQLQKGMPNVYYDGSPFVRFSKLEQTPANATVTFDYKKYGIDLRDDGNQVYMPFTTISDLYSDLYYHLAGFNGERVLVITDNDASTSSTLDPNFVSAILTPTSRTSAMASYSYSELCFVVDHFLGMPGRSPLESDIKSKGLDYALDQRPVGAEVKALLKSTDMTEYTVGLDALSAMLADGGHTDISVHLALSEAEDVVDMTSLFMEDVLKAHPRVAMEITTMVEGLDNFYKVFTKRQSCRSKNLPEGDQFYCKKGDTAFCIFDQFGPTDIEAWKNYYSGLAPMPELDYQRKGELAVVIDALKKASEDPEIKNFVLDLTNNPGGSLDVVVAINSLFNGQSHVRMENLVTGQKCLVNYDVDRNFDGKFDEKDNEVKYNLNFAVLTSSTSFSCGNLLPALMKDQGILLIGERTGGGACAVQNFFTAEGLQFQLSSARGRLANASWQNIDAGIEPDVPIEVAKGKYPDYTAFYDLDKLSTIINEWYAK